MSERSGIRKPNVFIFGWPSFLGGADTKLSHLLLLLHEHCSITVVPNSTQQLRDGYWTDVLRKLGVVCTSFENLPTKLDGFGLALSNECFFEHGIAHRAKQKGLKIVWSSEMMWHHKGELEAARNGVIDKVLFTSELQRTILSHGYQGIPGAITGNFIDPEQFPFQERRHSVFAIGRLSRAAVEKYPEDFPAFYECLALPECRYRVMAWNDELKKKYQWHRFDERWDLLEPEAEPQLDFLHSLDLFVYPLGHNFQESWGRSTVEAMLTGCIPLVPPGHHLENLIVHGESGFLCADFMEYQSYSHELYFDVVRRLRISRQCADHARKKHCSKVEHLKVWMEIFNDER